MFNTVSVSFGALCPSYRQTWAVKAETLGYWVNSSISSKAISRTQSRWVIVRKMPFFPEKESF